ncbi:hypothetical protein [Bacillus sp. FJAT-52991]|uniref:Uncharacterized protein n=1 Tax=Bacillus kandeliae TaxID=3129297 RepID=A0ABZ2NA67_9BACI
MMLPIDLDLLEKRIAIPALLAELSYLNEHRSVELVRVWGEKTMAITSLYDLLLKEIQVSSCQQQAN